MSKVEPDNSAPKTMGWNNRTNIHINTLFFSVVSSLMLTFGFFVFEEISYSLFQKVLLGIFIFLLSSALVYFACRIVVPKRVRIYSFVFSFFLSTIYISFWPIYNSNGEESLRTVFTFFIRNCVYILGLTIVFASIITVLICMIFKLENKLSYTTGEFFKHPMLVASIIFFCWLPCYLSYYPGIMSYDMFAQTPQALGVEPISKYHPPLHTLFWRFCLNLEELTNKNALVTYSVLQMIIMAGCLAYLLYFFANKEVHTIFLTVAMLFFCFNPVVAIFSFIPAKDVLFSGAIIVFSVEMLLLISGQDVKIGCAIRYVISGVLCCLLRNNMIYAFVVALVFILLIVRHCRIRVAVCSMLVMVVFLIINGPIYAKLGFAEGNPREMLSVPIQQISYVVVQRREELSDVDIQNINQYLPTSELWYLYKTRNVDLIKVRFNTECFSNEPGAFFRLWGNIFGRYTDECLVTFLNMNMPYWYPSAETIDPNTIAEYIETCIYTYEQTGYEIKRNSKLPQLNGFYEDFVATAEIKRLAFLSPLFSVTTPIWVLLFTILVLFCRKKTELLAVVLPIFFLWCTYLLGPVPNCRYVFPIMLSYPIYMMLIFQTSKFGALGEEQQE